MADVHMITLQSSEGKNVQVPVTQVRMSITIRNMLEDLGMDEGEDFDEPIPLLNVTADILDKVVEFFQQYEGRKTELTEREEQELRESVISGWDKTFVEVPMATLFEMIKAANFLDIKPMLNLTCKAVAEMIKGKSQDEIKDLFGIQGDFTEEEVRQLLQENPWLREPTDTPVPPVA
eukprot:m.31142 g.31142  ORF g.31142 m.31142 type:complete len:177 (-) comp13951_c0_seq1:459-989(-)